MKLVAALIALGLFLGGCATVDRFGAANDVHALLVSIRDNDAAAFEQHIDRPALKREIEARLVARAQAADLDPAARALGALFARPLAEAAGDAVLRPAVFRAVAEYYGYSPSRPLPGPLAIGAALRPAGEGRICAPQSKDGPCVLIFTRNAGVWRLSGFEGETAQLRLTP